MLILMMLFFESTPYESKVSCMSLKESMEHATDHMEFHGLKAK